MESCIWGCGEEESMRRVEEKGEESVGVCENGNGKEKEGECVKKEFTHEKLKEVDAIFAEKIHYKNERKIKNYLQMYYKTGILPSEVFFYYHLSLLIMFFFKCM